MRFNGHIKHQRVALGRGGRGGEEHRLACEYEGLVDIKNNQNKLVRHVRIPSHKPACQNIFVHNANSKLNLYFRMQQLG